MIGDLTQREDELGGKTLLIVGLGQISGRLAQLAKAFDMRVIGIRRDPRAGAGHADVVHAMSDLNALLPQADFVALTCPLTAETEKLIDADALGRMKPSAYLLNVARGRVVDERVIWPSVCQFDHGRVISARTAASSFATPLPNEATRLVRARSIQGISPITRRRRAARRYRLTITAPALAAPPR
jgi:phosphoribosylaminoimidazole carboxylase (NCAIR synthetase)